MNVLGGKMDNSFYLFVHYKELDNPLQIEMDNLFIRIESSLQGNDLSDSIKNSFPALFNLRLAGLRELLNSGDDVFETISDAYKYFEEIASNPRLGLLGENILFAIRSSSKIAEKLFTQEGGIISTSEVAEAVQQVQLIDYNGFTNLVKLAPQAISGSLIEWINASLTIEFIILTGAMINEGRLNITDQKIDELSFAIADATQDYNAISIETGLIKFPTNQLSDLITALPQEGNFIVEQKKLANSGLSDYSKNIN